ncbi:hypothetical protein BH10PSE5_BH10PSE5_05700 [soil metagenome]
MSAAIPNGRRGSGWTATRCSPGAGSRTAATCIFRSTPPRPDLFDPVLAWFEATADGETLTTVVLDNDPDGLVRLAGRGYRALGDHHPFALKMSRTLEDLPPVILPDGFRARSMAQVQDPERRALAHRNAWSRIAGREAEPPGRSRVTGESYRQVMAAWPYRQDLDWVIEAPDGRLAANACLWLDEVHGTGLFEPVGTDADFRRLGLAQAVCLAALQALKAAGARLALVGPRGDDGYPAPRALYSGLGFTPYARDIVHARKRLA